MSRRAFGMMGTSFRVLHKEHAIVTTIGISGARRNATAAVSIDGRLAAVVEQERVTRVRGIGVAHGGFPLDAMTLAARVAGVPADEAAEFAMAERGIEAPRGARARHLDYRQAHTAGAFLTSPCDEAVVVVCDRAATPELSVFRATSDGLVEHPVEAARFATIFGGLAQGLGFAPSGDEHLLESLGRIGNCADVERARTILGVSPGTIRPAADYIARIDAWNAEGTNDRLAQAADIATTVQEAIADALVDLLRRVKPSSCDALCLAGDLFYNSFFNTAVRRSGVFDRVFVPVNPGDPGVAVGCALAGSDAGSSAARVPHHGSPFLGPGYSAEEIKAVLDNCKLAYDYATDREIEDRVVAALMRGQLVAWFQGRMEYGPRALGNRSILANPLAPHVLENLNRFLKQREAYRTYGVSVCAEDAPQYFDGPASSEFMQYEFTVRDPERFRSLLVTPASRIRVHTAGSPAGEDAHDPQARFRRMLKAFGEASGAPVLVNTSFNGFHEPIVCSPRDAVRVFYGTGLDMLVIGNFVLRK